MSFGFPIKSHPIKKKFFIIYTDIPINCLLTEAIKNILLNLVISKNRENTHIEKGQRLTCCLHRSHVFRLLPADPFLLRHHFLLFSTRLQQYTRKCHFRAIAIIDVKGCIRCIFSQSETFNSQFFWGGRGACPQPP